MCFKAEAFRKVGLLSTSTGYHRGVFAEDVEFSLRVRRLTGKKLYYLPDMKVLNKAYAYWLPSRFIVARSSWIGYSRRNIAKMTGKGQLGIGTSLLVSLLRSLVPQNQNQSRLTDELKGTTVSILALFSMALGYFLVLCI